MNNTDPLFHYRETFYKEYIRPKASGDENILRQAEPLLMPKNLFLTKVIQRHFPREKEARIIDLGCGDGKLLFLAKACGYKNLAGFDVSEGQVALAHALGLQQVYLKEARSAAQSLADHSVDVIVSFDVIEHMNKNEVLAFSLEVFRVLRPGGRWIIHTLNAESPFFGRIRYGDFTHENGFTKESARQLLFIAGFQQVQSYEDVPIAHGVKSFFRYLAWKIIRSIYRFCLAAETGEKNGIFSQNFLVVAKKDE